METKELPIYTNVICKGEALKRKACKLYSFSEKQKGIMKDACKALALSDLIYEDAKKIYIEFLKMKVNNTGVYGKAPIFACVYLSALKNGDYRHKRELRILNITPPTITEWVREISRVVDIERV